MATKDQTPAWMSDYGAPAGPATRTPNIRERSMEASISSNKASAASSAATTGRIVALLPAEKATADAEAAVAAHKARTLGFEKADEEFQKQLVAWRSGEAATTFERLQELRNAVRLLKSGRQLTGAAFGQLPDFIKAAVSPDSVDVRTDVEKVIQQSLRETLGAQFTQAEGDRLLARVYNPALPETMVAKNVETEINKILAIAKSREAMARYYEAQGTLKGYKPDEWLPTVERDFKVSQGMTAADKLAATQNAILEAQGQIGGEGLKGFRFRPNEEAALMAYANSPGFTPVGYANLISSMYESAGVGVPSRSVLLEQGRELAKRPQGARVGRFGYDLVDEQAMRDAGLKDSVIQALRNLPESGYNLVAGVFAPVTDAVKSIAQGERAGLYKTVPDLVADLAAKAGLGETDQATLDALSQALSERYGGLDAIKATAIKDPIGLAGDISLILTAGGAAVARAAPTIGSAMSRTGAALDPLAVTGRAVKAAAPVASAVADAGGRLATEGLSFTSGAPTSAIREAYGAGVERQAAGVTPRVEAFREGISGEADIPTIVSTGRDALAKIREEASQRYRSGMVDIGKDKSILDFTDLDKTLTDLTSSGRYKGQTIRKGGSATLDKMRAAIDEWRNLDPAEYHTPEGFDALKQQLGDIRDTIPADDRVAMRVATRLYNAAKQTVRKQAPAYDKVMGQYKGSMDEVQRMERELSLGPQGPVDTAMLKLTSRPGTRRGREGLVDLMAKYEPTLGASVAGEQLSPLLPRGLRGVSMAAGAIPAGLYWTPAGIGYAALTSPRAVGEMAYGAGRARQGISDLADLAGRYPAAVLGAQRGIALAEQTEEERLKMLLSRYGLELPSTTIPGYEE